MSEITPQTAADRKRWRSLLREATLHIGDAKAHLDQEDYVRLHLQQAIRNIGLVLADLNGATVTAAVQMLMIGKERGEP